jgi:apolipoprotein D and lipocalin family protein
MKQRGWAGPLAALFLVGCGAPAPPAGIQPVTGFELEPYLGTWHEIARLDHRFERGLEQVRAEYSLNPDGSVRVVNSGYHSRKQKWKTATGRARFTGARDVGSLQVSFFRPFWAGYHVFALDPQRYALVTSGSSDYLWLLAREKSLPAELKSSLLATAAEAGFDTNALVWVNQSPD